jgi:hypothetical protein
MASLSGTIAQINDFKCFGAIENLHRLVIQITARVVCYYEEMSNLLLK